MPLDAHPTTGVATASRETAQQLRCGSRWAVCHTHPQAERWAATNLRRQGYNAYLPLRTVLRRDRCLPTHSRPVAVPLWTGYLFVDLQSDRHWTPIAHTLGVARLLMAGPNPYILPEAAISMLQAGEDVRRMPPGGDTSAWRPGAAVALARGAMEGLPAVITTITGQQARIAMMFLGQLRHVSVPLDALVPAQEIL
jgi:transcription antitermination factor NusG